MMVDPMLANRRDRWKRLLGALFFVIAPCSVMLRIDELAFADAKHGKNEHSTYLILL